MVLERTKEYCTPNPRWTPVQYKQMKIPLFRDTHWGFACPQSKHLRFWSICINFWNRSCSAFFSGVAIINIIILSLKSKLPSLSLPLYFNHPGPPSQDSFEPSPYSFSPLLVLSLSSFNFLHFSLIKALSVLRGVCWIVRRRGEREVD